MNRDTSLRMAVLSLSLLVAAAPGAAAGGPQAPGPNQSRTAASQQGPLVLEPIESGFVFAPEVRFTRVDRFSSMQVGGYGGWLVSDAILLGAGGYGLVAGPDGVGMRYGGIVAGFTLPVGDGLRFGVRGLFGFGEARLVERLPVTCPNPSVDFAPCFHSAWVRQDFVVFEPQATIGARLGPKVTFELSGGYRVIGNAGGWEGRLQSGFGSAAIRFGPF
jgi:hypothetical protein